MFTLWTIIHPAISTSTAQRVISTRWVVSPLPPLDAHPINPQRVELPRWGFSSSPCPRCPPHRPPTCHFDALGAFSISGGLNTHTNDPPACRIDTLGGFLPFPLSTPTSSTPNVSIRHVGGFPRRLALGAHPINPQRVISIR